MTSIDHYISTDETPRAHLQARVEDFIALLKPRVMSLVVFTGLAGLLAAPGDIHPVIAAIAVFCIAVSAGAAGAINMWYDRDIDAVMNRTKSRPIVTGRVRPDDALAFGVMLSLASTMLMGLAVNWLAAILLASANLFYVFVYTIWLKRRTPQNIVIGGAAGAFPPMIGWAAVTGNVSIESIALFSLIFFWTPPHFWALSLYANSDYTRARVPMLPVVAGELVTKRHIFAYSLILLPLSLAPYFLGIAGLTYAVVTAILSTLFIIGAVKVWREDGAKTRYKAARTLFGFSILYLFIVYMLLFADGVYSGLRVFPWL